jgi:hypothetical protein
MSNLLDVSPGARDALTKMIRDEKGTKTHVRVFVQGFG